MAYAGASMRRNLTFGIAVALVAACGEQSRADIEGLGAIGDSLTDEYFEQNFADISYARCWTQLLVEQRGLDMGPTAEEDGQEGDTWGEPRRSGYQHNWARFGATSASMLLAGQHTGLADAVTNDGVTHAVMFIGANDFSPFTGNYQPIYNGVWDDEEIDAWIDGRLANMRTALETLEPTGVGLVVVNIGDWGVSLYIRNAFPDPSRRELVDDVIARANDGIEALAREFDRPVVDFYALMKSIFGDNHDPSEVLLVGNVEIATLEADDGGGGNPATAWCHDRLHPNTVIHGITANAVTTAFELAYGEGLDRFTEEEILAHAGLQYGGKDTLPGQIGDWSQYVLLPCAADVDGDGKVGYEDLLMLLAAWGNTEGPEDLNGDGVVGYRDLLVLLSSWGAC